MRLAMMVAVFFCGLSTQAMADTVLITGSGRGIGLEFARQYAERGYTVIATALDPNSAELQALASRHANIMIEKLDVTNQADLKALAAKYRGQPIDILLNNAGIGFSDAAKQSPEAFDRDEFLKIMEVNTLGAMLVTQAFRQNVIDSSQKKIVGLSSHVSSTTSGGGGLLFYSISKAALNRGLRGLGTEIGNGVLVGLLYPGAVWTTGTPPEGSRGLPVRVAVQRMIVAIDKMTPEIARKPLTIDGRPAEW